jgi:hypothetical protein
MVRQKLENAEYIVFIHDPSFQPAYRRGLLAGNGVDSRIEWRVDIALWAAECCRRVPGDFVECGVKSGVISSALMEKHERQRIEKIFVLVDTFGGPVLSQYSDEEVRIPGYELRLSRTGSVRVFWTRLSIGGMVLLDDYASYGYEASARAIDGAAELRGTEVLSLPTGQGLVLKTSET